MPMITVRILAGHKQETKDTIAAGISRVVKDATGLSSHDIWIVFEDVPAKDWYVGESNS